MGICLDNFFFVETCRDVEIFDSGIKKQLSKVKIYHKNSEELVRLLSFLTTCSTLTEIMLRGVEDV